MLKCGIHPCASKCHQISDHSKMQCDHILYSTCPKGHQKPWKCHAGPPDTCSRCTEDTKIAERRQKAAFIAQEKRDREQRLQDQRMADLEAQIQQEQTALRDRQLAEEREQAYERRKVDLQNLLNSTQAPYPKPAPSNPTPTNPASSNPVSTNAASSTPVEENTTTSSSPPKPTIHTAPNSPPQPNKATASTPSAAPKKRGESEAENEWQRQKQVEGAKNQPIDAIMEMGGLEKVKSEILKIKAKADVIARQGSSLKKERFSVSMLGNPGTGS